MAIRPEPVTPDRKTHFIVDGGQFGGQEPAFSLERQHHHMCRGTNTRPTKLVRMKDVGWMLQYYGFTPGHFESTFPSAPEIPLTVASSVLLKSMARVPQNTELADIRTGSGGSISNTGLPMYQKAPAASWDLRLDADQTAYPSVDTSDDTIKMDRLAVSVSNDTKEGGLFFSFILPGSTLNSPQKIANIYFNAPAGRTKDNTGIGQYAVSLYGSGKGILFEKNTNGDWVSCCAFKFGDTTVTGNAGDIILSIYKSANVSNSTGAGGAIVFMSKAVEAVNNTSSSLDTLISLFNRGLTTDLETYVYKIPKAVAGTYNTTLEKIRIDIRRDLRAYWNISKYVYYTTAELQDDTFAIPFYPGDLTSKFTLEWNAVVPTGTTIELKLYSAELGTELTMVTSGTNFKTYTPAVFGNRGFYIKAFFTSDGTNTPIFVSYKVYRNIVSNIVQTEVEYNLHSGIVNITGPERDISHERASLSFKDPADLATLFKLRANMLCRIETEYDPLDDTKRCVLFDGYLARATAHQIGGGITAQGFGGGSEVESFPANDWKRYDCELIGQHQRLSESLTTVGQMLWDYTTKQPFKVTDFIRDALGWCGYESSQINIPDIDIRLWESTSSDKSYISPLSNMLEILQDASYKYLGFLLHWDSNLGKWVLIQPPVKIVDPPYYTPLARFITTHPGIGSTKKLSHSLKSYATDIPTGFVRKNTFASWIKPPEGNKVTVSTIGNVSPDNVESKYDCVIYNFASFDFNSSFPTADPNSPDYLGRAIPIFYMDPALGTGAKTDDDIKKACEWVARRIYDVACHGVKCVSFEAPLLLIEHPDDATKKRPLRFYDPIYINENVYLIRSCNIVYKKDSVQMAMYECEVPNL